MLMCNKLFWNFHIEMRYLEAAMSLSKEEFKTYIVHIFMK